jgi:PPE-repeat protein
MTAPPDFAMLPPEVNSGRMYAGAGAGPLLAAASAWNGLAAELRATALGYSSVLSELTSQAWHGPASASMAAAAAPYVAWLSTAAAQAEETAAQAEAAVAAYEAAFAATVPPPVIAANRAQLMVLIATNFFGQNTPAIAATEAQYAEMWAQDAAAMYGYAASSAIATRLTPFTQPQQTTSPSAPAAQSAAVAKAAATPAGSQQSTLSQLVSTMPNTLQGLSSPSSSQTTGLGSILGDLGGWNPFAPGSASATSGLDGVLDALFGTNTAFGQFINAPIWNTIFASGFYMPGRYLGSAAKFITMGQQAAGDASSAAEGVAGAAEGVAQGAAAGPLGSIGALGNSVTATLGKGGLVGPLSVPPSWTGPTPLPSPLASTLGGAPLAAPSPVTVGTPPVPLAGYMGGQGEGQAVPQYGFRPTFVARPPAAG